jgi:hypothetical protein
MAPSWRGVGNRRVEPPVANRVAGHDSALTGSWRVTGESLQIGWSNGFVGTLLTVDMKTDVWRGTAQATHDVVGGPPQPTASVQLRRVTCTGVLRGGG